jgi:hypothetical protein
VTYVLRLPYEAPPVTTNDVRGNKRGKGHHMAQHEEHKGVAESIGWVARQAKVPHLDMCAIRLIWLLPGEPRVDNDALAVFLKAAKDGLVWAKVIDDDRCQIVVEDRMRIVTGVGRDIAPAMLLEIEPLDGAMSVPDAWTSAR